MYYLPAMTWMILALGLLYCTVVAYYRLYLSPIARYPGPKLAALTQWYETYFDVLKQGGGQFLFEIRRMHKKYGPIVRINPWELHIDDPAFYDAVYPANGSVDKMPFFSHRFNLPGSIVSTHDAELHRVRRTAVASMFSRARVIGHGHVIQGTVDRLSRRLSREFAGTGKIVNIWNMWASAMSDSVSEYVFCSPSSYMDTPSFNHGFPLAVQKLTYTTHVMGHFGFLVSLMNLIPDWLTAVAKPSMKAILDHRKASGPQHTLGCGQEIQKRITNLLVHERHEFENTDQRTLFHEILSAKIPEEEKSFKRMQDEAMGIIAAGIESTKWTLTLACYHIVANPKVEERLRAELLDAIPDPSSIPHFTELEKINYLRAVVLEALRLSCGTVQRLPRIHRKPLAYGAWTIPVNVPVGMDTYHNHFNPTLFPDAERFLPERWLGNPRVTTEPLVAGGVRPKESKPLSSYLTAFSRGTRMCLGMNLSYAEIYVSLATMFRRHKFALHETSADDVRIAFDFLSPQPPADSKGVFAIFSQ